MLRYLRPGARGQLLSTWGARALADVQSTIFGTMRTRGIPCACTYFAQRLGSILPSCCRARPCLGQHDATVVRRSIFTTKTFRWGRVAPRPSWNGCGSYRSKQPVMVGLGRNQVEGGAGSTDPIGANSPIEPGFDSRLNGACPGQPFPN